MSIGSTLIGSLSNSMGSSIASSTNAMKEESLITRFFRTQYTNTIINALGVSTVNTALVGQQREAAAKALREIETRAVAKSRNIFGKKPIYITDSPSLKNSPYGTGVSSAVIDNVARAHGLFNRDHDDYYYKFNRFGFIDPFTTNTSTKEYIFITKPDLHLFDANGPNPELTETNPFFAENLERYIDVARQLQYSYDGPSKGPFMPLLSNAFTGHVDMPSISSDTVETANNVFGIHINYRGTSYLSDFEPEVSIEFKDSKYLEVYMLLKIYDEYEKMKWLGNVTPPSNLYTYRKVLHDQVTLYKFIVGDDGMSIRYFARFIGGTLTSVPRDYFGDMADGEITLSTSWKFHFVQDMDPMILTDFNRITNQHRKNKQFSPLWDSTYHMANPDWPSCPGIYVNTNETGRSNRYNRYYLLWFD